MSTERFKQILVRDKEWLRQLYESDSIPNTKRLITFATDVKLDTLLKFIHYLSNGVIKMTKENFEKIGNKHLKLIKKDFESKRAIKAIINSERNIKISRLFKLIPILKFLLFTLFNRN